MFAPLALSRSINTPTDKLPLDQSTRERTSARARGLACSLARSLAPARSPLYRYFCSGLSFLSGAPLLHPTMVYLKCHGGEGVHAHAHVQSSERCWPTGWLRALHRPCCQTAYVYVRVDACARACMCIPQAQSNTRAREYARARALIHTRTHSIAILRRSANQWRNCKPVHPRGPHGHTTCGVVDFQSPSHLRFSPFFTQSPSTVSLVAPNFAPKLFFMFGESRLRGS